MIKPKKPIAFVCAAALLLSPTGAFAASPSDFVDFPNDWSTGAMTAAVDNGLLGGVDGEHIAPQGVLTRAQMAAIINRAFGAEKNRVADRLHRCSSQCLVRNRHGQGCADGHLLWQRQWSARA